VVALVYVVISVPAYKKMANIEPIFEHWSFPLVSMAKFLCMGATLAGLIVGWGLWQFGNIFRRLWHRAAATAQPFQS
jgi:hypothetical protein